ncbi:MAG: PQQ-binding-like beta-propeller repeat protein [Leptolyngbyaceae cyanobacterium CSU_1_4]|nr:PQQ-binding-like beta-propeller repeat protein [Leptolyngbyaceae cyanobacterium CSU_1_4]
MTAPSPTLPRRTVRPIGVYALHGLASDGTRLMALDSVRGYVLQVDCANDNTTVLNPLNIKQFVEAQGLAIWGEQVWFTQDNRVYWCTLQDFTPRQFVTLPYPVNGVAVWHSTVYVTCQKAGYILVYDATTGKRITQFSAPGVGEENLTVRDEELWVCDRIEQTVYCMDRATGEINYSILTPFDSPCALAFHPAPASESEDCLYVAYAGEEAYIRDDPNNLDNPYQLTFRDRTFIHPLYFSRNEAEHYTLSNGYLIEMSYIEELSPLEDVAVDQLEWRIALPAETVRQKLIKIEAIGVPFTEEQQDGQRVAVFRFDRLSPHEGRLFGWKALLEVRSIKYYLKPEQVEKSPPLSLEFQARYLVDDDELAMDTPTIRRAAEEAIGTETNILRKILKIRNYVYDRMSYGIKPHIDTPDVALERGVGSCGEYVGILLALARLNGIACRTVGRYKCPPQPEKQGVPLQPEFNHVWIEFYVPGFGWLPMESNVDDITENGPYPTRFFMGLPWYHAEMSKGISFEKIAAPALPEEISIGNLALNHIRFTILGELPPPE